MLEITPQGMIIGLPVVKGTAGSVLFVDANGNLGQKNANLYWDNTNNRLGIGVTPTATLQVNAVTTPTTADVLIGSSAIAAKALVVQGFALQTGFVIVLQQSDATLALGFSAQSGRAPISTSFDNSHFGGSSNLGTGASNSIFASNPDYRIRSNGAYKFSNNSGDSSTTADTSISRNAAAVIAIGNGTTGDTSGSITNLRSLGTSVAVVTKTGTYTVLTTDEVVLADATAAAFTVTLPAASNTGMKVVIIKLDVSVNAVTVSRAGADTIQGSNTQSLALQYDKTILVADGGTKWYDLGKGLI